MRIGSMILTMKIAPGCSRLGLDMHVDCNGRRVYERAWVWGSSLKHTHNGCLKNSC